MPFFRLRKPVLEVAREINALKKPREIKQEKEKPLSAERLRSLQSILHSLYRGLEKRRANGKGKKVK